jgi:hypothetical protein
VRRSRTRRGSGSDSRGARQRRRRRRMRRRRRKRSFRRRTGRARLSSSGRCAGNARRTLSQQRVQAGRHTSVLALLPFGASVAGHLRRKRVGLVDGSVLVCVSSQSRFRMRFRRNLSRNLEFERKSRRLRLAALPANAKVELRQKKSGEKVEKSGEKESNLPRVAAASPRATLCRTDSTHSRRGCRAAAAAPNSTHTHTVNPDHRACVRPSPLRCDSHQPPTRPPLTSGGGGCASSGTAESASTASTC